MKITPGRGAPVLAVLAIVVAVMIVACGPRAADYSPVKATTTAAAEADETADETAGQTQTDSTAPTPIADYLSSVGVTGEQVPLDKLTDLKVTLPRPPGWTKYANPNLSPGTEAIAKNNTYPTAMVMVFKLNGNFDVAEALKHADASAEMSENFTKLNYSEADFKGFPSSMIEGSYDLNGQRLHTYNRIVIPVTPAPKFQRYLVQFTVTSLSRQAAPEAGDIESVIGGFTVAVT
ncbi:MAG: hypothetical protein EBU54_03710 [Mycobacteriaceae bacterium]|nr:hypothetical protein [Mycobacteriaceae bacterium]